MRDLRRIDLHRAFPNAAFLLVATFIALALRATLVSATNDDVRVFQEWLDALRAGGGFSGLDDDISTYPPVWSYMVLVSDAVLGAARDTFVLKAGAIAADVVGAAYAYRIVRLAYPVGLVPAFAYTTVLLAPTVVVNSAYWGQVDMLWVAPIVACVYYVLKGRSVAAFVALGVGLAFKQQAVFITPFLVVLAARRVVPWRHFLILPLIYLVSILPAFVAGRSLRSLLEVYWSQTGQFEQLTLGAASVYAFLPDELSVELGRPAVIWSLAALSLVTLAALLAPLDYRSPRVVVALAAASVLVTPLLLPHMHERYFFAADILLIVAAYLVPRLMPIAVAVQIVSFSSSWSFLVDRELFPLAVLAVVQLGAAAALVTWIVLTARAAPGTSSDVAQA